MVQVKSKQPKIKTSQKLNHRGETDRELLLIHLSWICQQKYKLTPPFPSDIFLVNINLLHVVVIVPQFFFKQQNTEVGLTDSSDTELLLIHPSWICQQKIKLN